MIDRFVPEIADDVYYVGVKDYERRLFDSLIPLPQGTSYNSYLVKGRDRVALIDTVNPGFEGELEARISQVSELEDLDYVVMNHAEPDHAGAIPYIMERNSDALLLATEKGAEMAKNSFDVSSDRMETVGDGELLDLGGKTLRFIEAPMLHWPETMFTYLEENRILFPCDFMGFHSAYGMFDEDVEQLIPHAKSYFGEILMPFRSMGARAMEKIKNLEIEVIAPSHGPIHRNPKRILNAYDKWTRGETEDKVIVVYVSMWGSTSALVKNFIEVLKSEGVQVAPYNLTAADLGDIARDLVDSRAVVLGTPTVLNGMHPLAIYASYLVKALRPPLGLGVVLSSYGWSGGALRQAKEILGPTGIELVGTVEVKGPPAERDLQKVSDLGRALADRVKSSGG